MGKLKRFIEIDHILGFLYFQDIAFFERFLEPASPNLDQAFKFIPSVPEVTHCINVETVLSHADCVSFQVYLSCVILLIDILAILLHSLLELCLLVLGLQRINGAFLESANNLIVLLFLIHELCFDTFIFFACKREIFAFPLPVEIPLAVVLILVKYAARTYLFINNRHWLKSIREDNVRIHSRDVHVIYQGFLLVNGALHLYELKFVHYLILDVVIVCDQLLVNLEFHL